MKNTRNDTPAHLIDNREPVQIDEICESTRDALYAINSNSKGNERETHLSVRVLNIVLKKLISDFYLSEYDLKSSKSFVKKLLNKELPTNEEVEDYNDLMNYKMFTDSLNAFINTKIILPSEGVFQSQQNINTMKEILDIVSIKNEIYYMEKIARIENGVEGEEGIKIEQDGKTMYLDPDVIVQECYVDLETKDQYLKIDEKYELINFGEFTSIGSPLEIVINDELVNDIILFKGEMIRGPKKRPVHIFVNKKNSQIHSYFEHSLLKNPGEMTCLLIGENRYANFSNGITYNIDTGTRLDHANEQDSITLITLANKKIQNKRLLKADSEKRIQEIIEESEQEKRNDIYIGQNVVDYVFGSEHYLNADIEFGDYIVMTSSTSGKTIIINKKHLSVYQTNISKAEKLGKDVKIKENFHANNRLNNNNIIISKSQSKVYYINNNDELDTVPLDQVQEANYEYKIGSHFFEA